MKSQRLSIGPVGMKLVLLLSLSVQPTRGADHETGPKAKSAFENVGQASSLPVHGASSPRVSGGRTPPKPADKMSAPDFQTGAKEIVERYLAMPHAERDMGEARMARLAVLAQLSRASDALSVIRGALPTITDPRQRAELAEMMGRNIQIPDSASALIELLKDPDEGVRGAAVHGLRLMSRRTDRSGGKRLARQPDGPPRVDGLVPALISAANDSSEGIRVTALYALADARDPQATQEIRKHLLDPSRKVRFHAACFLTEFQDASGLQELKLSLRRLQISDPDKDILYYSEAEMLLASFERLTGKTFGEIPMNPIYSSDTRRVPGLREGYRKLLEEWWNFLSTDEGKRLLENEAGGKSAQRRAASRIVAAINRTSSIEFLKTLPETK